MSCELFRQRLSRVQVHPNDLQWMPCWLERYAGWTGAREGMPLAVTHAQVLGFLRSLRDLEFRPGSHGRRWNAA